MNATTMKAVNRSNSVTGLDSIPLSKSARRQASESLRQGELFAEFVLYVLADLRAVALGVEHAVASLVSGIRALFAKPLKH